MVVVWMLFKWKNPHYFGTLFISKRNQIYSECALRVYLFFIKFHFFLTLFAEVWVSRDLQVLIQEQDILVWAKTRWITLKNIPSGQPNQFSPFEAYVHTWNINPGWLKLFFRSFAAHLIWYVVKNLHASISAHVHDLKHTALCMKNSSLLKKEFTSNC